MPSTLVAHPDTSEIFITWNQYYSWYVQSSHYKPGKPWIGVVTYNSYYKGEDYEIHSTILKNLESRGYNVILGFGSVSQLISEFFKDGNKSRISALIAPMAFNLIYNDPVNTTKLLATLDIPVFAPIVVPDLEAWNSSIDGVSAILYAYVAMPELEGRIEPIVIGGGITKKDDETGINYYCDIPLMDRIHKLTERVVNWIKLQEIPNSNKKIAIIYYNIEGGKDGVSATYLNVPESISRILQAMQAAGYRTEVKTVPEIINIFLTLGNNIGSWAPGELEKIVKSGAITIPIEKYLEWFNKLPEELRNSVIAQWGEAPGNVMVYNGNIVIPGVMLGNIFLGPQPMRGYGEDQVNIIHNLTVPPTHQYLAFYFWLQNEYCANAVIHLGTHGTLEWLPGKSVGLSAEDWPDILIGNIPDIYPYIVNNPGEGTQAKRRGYAVIISHNIPPMIPSGLYGELAELSSKLSLYKETTDYQRKEIISGEIKELIKKLDIDKELSLNFTAQPFDGIVDTVEHKLEELASTLIPYGLHTFGFPLSNETLDTMVESIVSFDPENRNNTVFRDKIRKLLAEDYEMSSLLAALEGRYIPPARGADPLRVPDALPTGTNFYSFDPRCVPDTAAWEIGRKLADDLISSYYNLTGHYPESIGTVLWAIETMNTYGQTVAMILRLIGAEPVWDKSGRFIGIKPTPLSELGRPRIDVLVTISGLFRDSFIYTIEKLDDAIRAIISLNESPTDNYLRKHYLEELLRYRDLDAETAALLAGARIFGDAPGSYGNGVSDLVESTSKWEGNQELIDCYFNHMSYIYGKGVYGLKAREAFSNKLEKIDATMQIRFAMYGVLDNDDVYSYLGGLTMAARSVSGKLINVYIGDTYSSITPKVETLNSFLAKELRTRLYNPKWIEGMLSQGFSGGHEISKEIGYLFGWSAVTPELVQDWMWQRVAETYVLDSSVRDRFRSVQPYSYASTVAWLLEASRRGLWRADSATLQRLADEYISAVNEYGVVCCHHTCANIVFNEWVVKLSSLNQAALRKFASAMAAATGKSIDVPGSDMGSDTSGGTGDDGLGAGETGAPSSGSSGGISGSTPSEAASSGESSEASEVSQSEPASESGKAYEVAASSQSGSASTQTPFYALAGIIGIVCLLGAGYFYQGRN
ncbi:MULTISPECIES: cobaltochelatase subunit CobN [unclassified Methanothermobacter]|uniref:cobaltochelatase subunit CobN n=1 Tax=unclassified Methanothermobacter TaxID=2631116 RepID=UPI001F5BBBE5|nr:MULTISPECIES: cobaltochelatase subunit CobN [unclassified Methanothermobacter]